MDESEVDTKPKVEVKRLPLLSKKVISQPCSECCVKILIYAYIQ